MKITKAIKVLISLPPSILALILAIFLLWTFKFNPHHNEIREIEPSLELEQMLTKKQAIGDIKYFYKSIRQKHPVWVDGSDEKKLFFEENYSSILEKYKSEPSDKKFSVLQIWQDCSKLSSILMDAHTNIYCNSSDNDYYIEDFSQIQKYGLPEKIDGISFDKVLANFLKHYGWEIEEYAAHLFKTRFYFSKSYLQLLGFDVENGIDFTFKTCSDISEEDSESIINEKTVTLEKPDDFYKNIDDRNFDYKDFHYNFKKYDGKTIVHYDNSDERLLSNINLPVGGTFFYKNTDKLDEIERLEQLEKENKILIYGNTDNWIWYFTDKNDDVAVLILKKCNYNDEYLNTLNHFFETVLELGISRIAVDLRGNGGGNSRVANSFISHLNIDSYKTIKGAVRYGTFLFEGKGAARKNNKTEKTFDGEVFVITDIETFSSAMMFAQMIEKNGLGKVVGEKSGNSPASYGDIIQMQLPASKLYFTCSYKKWYPLEQFEQ